VFLKPLLGLVFNSQKRAATFVNWYYSALRSDPNQEKKFESVAKQRFQIFFLGYTK
jgi:hypothetical protein